MVKSQKGGSYLLEQKDFTTLSKSIKQDPGNIILKVDSVTKLLKELQTAGGSRWVFFDNKLKENSLPSLDTRIGKYLFLASDRGVSTICYHIEGEQHYFSVNHIKQMKLGGKSRKSRKSRSRKN